MSTEAISLLKSIDTTLKQLLALHRVEKPKDIASDADLDGQYGDPIVKAKDPRDWTGPSQKDKRFSECSSEYLELVASRLDFFADVAEREGKLANNGKPEAPYRRRDAARARGWAKRIRAGWHRPHGNGTNAPSAPPTAAGFADRSEWPEDQMSDGDISWG